MDKQLPNIEPLQSPFQETVQGPVGLSVPRVDANAKVTGKAQFGGDLIPQRADLFVGVVRSSHVHAQIQRIDAQAALDTPGIVGVYTANHVKGTNRQGLIFRDQHVLASEKVTYLGDAIAIVVGTSEPAVERAKAAVAVTYAPLPVLATLDDALAPGAIKLRPEGNILGGKRIRRGDAEAALLEPDLVIVHDTFQTQTVDHAFLDLEAGVACFDGEFLTIWASGQWVHEECRLVALALGLPLERVRVHAPATGGAFGGREDIGIQTLLGLAAIQHPNRLVALKFDREESMRVRHKRHPIRIDYSLGARRDGKLVVAKITIFSEEGCYASTGTAVMRKAASHCTGPYVVPHVWCDVFGVLTNNNPKGAMRGFGAVQMAVAYEGMMDRLARQLDIDRFELRRRNLVASGDPVTTGQRILVSSAHQCLETARKRFDATPLSDARPLKPHEKRGVGVSAICFGLGYGDGFPDASRAKVHVDARDQVCVSTGAVDYGQGVMTLVAQIVAEELGLKTQSIEVISADSVRTPEAGSTSASRQTYFTGTAVRLAAAELKHQLLDVASRTCGLHPAELRASGGAIVGRYNAALKVPLVDVFKAARQRGYSLAASAVFHPRTICEDFQTGQSLLAFATYLFGAHVCQVVVDTETGAVSVERYVACHDVGRAINPQSVEGQISGGVAQGIGMALMEQVVSEGGIMKSVNFRDYLLPTTRDLPPIQAEIEQLNDPTGPYGAHGVGEPPVVAAAPAVLSAIADAIGVFPRSTPCTPQAIWTLLRGST